MTPKWIFNMIEIVISIWDLIFNMSFYNMIVYCRDYDIAWDSDRRKFRSQTSDKMDG